LRSLVTALALLVLASAPRLDAQTMSVGTRVRVKGSDYVVPVVGNVQTIRNDTLLLLEEGQGAQLWRFPIGDIRSVEESAGIVRNNLGKMKKWGLIGGSIGAGGSLLVDVILNRKAAPGYRYSYTKGFLAGGLLGGAVGAALGARIPVERWRSVPVPRRISVIPMRGGMSVDLGFGF